VRWARLFRNAERCAVEIAALACLPWSIFPLLAILALELWVAFRLDWRDLGKYGLGAIAARFVFSLALPWVVSANHIRGLFTAQQLSNRQNATGNAGKNDVLI
jgi:hypothetical protein